MAETLLILVLLVICVRQGFTIDRQARLLRQSRPSGSPLADPRHPACPRVSPR